MPVTGITIEADSVVIKGSDFDALCAAASERDELLKEVQRLQHALHFWLPHVPADGPEDIAQRCGDDAMLLVGYDPTEPVELDAEARGWIELQVPAQIRQLCPECLGYMPCAQHPKTNEEKS